jgi:hypothetical protein
MSTALARPTAAGTIPRIPTSISVFVAPAHFPSSEVLVSGFLETEAGVWGAWPPSEVKRA